MSGSTAEKPDLGIYHPSCFLAHDLVNRLSVVVGYCNLLEDETLENLVRHQYLRSIRELAKTMADDLNRHQCQIDATVRETVQKKATSASK